MAAAEATPHSLGTMSDQLFLKRFEACDIDPKQFDHEAHLRLGWIYICRYSLNDALNRFSDGLRRFTQKVGAEAKYHETITWFFLMLIAERQTQGDFTTFDSFLKANRDLADKTDPILLRYYSKERLDTPQARGQFLLPDRMSQLSAISTAACA